MIAGPSPHEEICCIRNLMPRAHITAIDIDRNNVEAAMGAGVDEAAHCDVGDFVGEKNPSGGIVLRPPRQLSGDKFDAICLDFTGPANDWLKSVFGVYYPILTAQGVMIVTLSYGRDVVERINWVWNCARASYQKQTIEESLQDIPGEIAARLWYVMLSRVRQLDSCLQYRGKSMPMLSCLLVKKHGVMPPSSFKVLSPADFELAVTSDNVGDIYACPAERIEQLRRSRTARKAVATRRARLLGGRLPLLLTDAR